jgi:hypothetical protein
VVPAAALAVEPIAAVRVWVVPLPAASLASVGANGVVELLVLAVAPLLSVPVVVLVRVAVWPRAVWERVLAPATWPDPTLAATAVRAWFANAKSVASEPRAHR